MIGEVKYNIIYDNSHFIWFNLGFGWMTYHYGRTGWSFVQNDLGYDLKEKL